MKKSVNKNKKMKLLTRRNVIIAIILLVIATPFVVFGYNKWLDGRDFENHSTIRNDIENLSEYLTEALGASTSFECSLPGVKFQASEYTCTSSLRISMNVASEEKVEEAIDRYISRIESQGSLIKTQSDRSPYPYLKMGLNVDTYDLSIKQGIDNAFGYVQFAHKTTGKPCSMSSSIVAQSLSISLNCSSKARNKYF